MLPINNFFYIIPIRKDNIYMKQSVTRFDFVDWFRGS